MQNGRPSSDFLAHKCLLLVTNLFTYHKLCLFPPPKEASYAVTMSSLPTANSDPADNPPLGPDDGGHPDPDEPDDDDFRAFETYKEYKAAMKLRAAHRRQEYKHIVAGSVLEL
jgi:hypothetical protein